jgi:D-alanyl-D-alanine carboxypeptidase
MDTTTTLRRGRLRAAATAAAILAGIGLGLSACATPEAASELSHRVANLTSLSDASTPTADDGYVPLGRPVSIFDEDLPTISKLDPALRAAVQDAATAAAADDVEMFITSGWRSAAYQQVLLDDATRSYGSVEEARRWVNTPELSTHVTGDAVDIGPTDADSWLSQHGADYGLCQIYANEMWHFELATEPGGTCPAQLPDSAG